MDSAAAESDKTRRGSRPAEVASSRNGLFDDDDEDLFAPAASRATAANTKGLCQSALACPGSTLCLKKYFLIASTNVVRRSIIFGRKNCCLISTYEQLLY